MRNRLFLFILISFGLSWGLTLIFRLSGGNLNSAQGLTLASAYMFMPLVAALLLQWFVEKESVLELLAGAFRLNRWFLVAWLVPPVLGLAAFGVALLLPGVAYSPGMEGMIERYQNILTPEQIARIREQVQSTPISPVWLALVEGLIAGISINAIAAFGEELGWRGYLFRLLREIGFWRMSLLTGLIWGVWHAPLIAMGHNYPQHPIAGIAMMTVWCMLLAPLFTYIRIRTGSVIAASIMHGTLNGTAGLAILLVAGGNDLTVGLTGLAGFIVLILANVVMVVYDWFYPTPVIRKKFVRP